MLKSFLAGMSPQQQKKARIALSLILQGASIESKKSLGFADVAGNDLPAFAAIVARLKKVTPPEVTDTETAQLDQLAQGKNLEFLKKQIAARMEYIWSSSFSKNIKLINSNASFDTHLTEMTKRVLRGAADKHTSQDNLRVIPTTIQCVVEGQNYPFELEMPKKLSVDKARRLTSSPKDRRLESEKDVICEQIEKYFAQILKITTEEISSNRLAHELLSCIYNFGNYLKVFNLVAPSIHVDKKEEPTLANSSYGIKVLQNKLILIEHYHCAALQASFSTQIVIRKEKDIIESEITTLEMTSYSSDINTWAPVAIESDSLVVKLFLKLQQLFKVDAHKTFLKSLAAKFPNYDEARVSILTHVLTQQSEFKSLKECFDICGLVYTETSLMNFAIGQWRSNVKAGQPTQVCHDAVLAIKKHFQSPSPEATVTQLDTEFAHLAWRESLPKKQKLPSSLLAKEVSVAALKFLGKQLLQAFKENLENKHDFIFFAARLNQTMQLKENQQVQQNLKDILGSTQMHSSELKQVLFTQAKKMRPGFFRALMANKDTPRLNAQEIADHLLAVTTERYLVVERLFAKPKFWEKIFNNNSAKGPLYCRQTLLADQEVFNGFVKALVDSKDASSQCALEEHARKDEVLLSKFVIALSALETNQLNDFVKRLKHKNKTKTLDKLQIIVDEDRFAKLNETAKEANTIFAPQAMGQQPQPAIKERILKAVNDNKKTMGVDYKASALCAFTPR